MRRLLGWLIAVEMVVAVVSVAIVHGGANDRSDHTSSKPTPRMTATTQSTLRSDPVSLARAGQTPRSPRQSRPSGAQSQDLLVEGQSGTLSPEASAALGQDGPLRNPRAIDQPGVGPRAVIEGSLSDGLAWRVTSERDTTGKALCIDFEDASQHSDGAWLANGGGGGCGYDPTFDVTGDGSGATAFWFWTGPVSERATAVLLQTTDGRIGKAWLHDAPAIGAQLFTAAIDCHITLKRIYAVDAQGHELASKPAPAPPCFN